MDPWGLYVSSHLQVFESGDDLNPPSVVLSLTNNTGMTKEEKEESFSRFAVVLIIGIQFVFVFSFWLQNGIRLGSFLALVLELGRGFALALALALGLALALAIEFALENNHEKDSVNTDFGKLLRHQDNHLTTIGAYEFEPLKDSTTTRLLLLFPGEMGSDLRGAIIHISLETPLEHMRQYSALSYVWGSDDKTHKLWTPAGSIPITSSLFSALVRLRDSESPITLWVDAICIDQEDDEEKSKQIQLLPRIFRLASNVIAYLGEEYEQSNLAIETLLQILAKDKQPFDKNVTKPVTPSSDSWEKRRIPPVEHEAWAAISSLFSRRWFRRTWIVQEFIAARHLRVVCGAKYDVDWKELLAAIKVAERETKASEEDYTSLGRPWENVMTLARYREWEAKKTRWTLLQLLESFGYTEAKLRRDRLFALLGFALDGNDEAFEPDYKSSFKEIVLRYSRKFIEQSQVMQLLHRAGINPKDETFPSWIPDWTIYKRGTLYDASGLGIPCAASGYSSPRTLIEDDELIIRGKFVDVITVVSKAANKLESLESYLNEVEKIVDSLSAN